MEGVKLVLVGKSVTDNTFVSRTLLQHHGFAEVRFMKPVIRLRHNLYGRTTDVRWSAVTVAQYYDVLYGLDHDTFLRNLDFRLPKIRKSNIVIPDPRYINEVVGLAERGFTIVRVVSEITRKPRMIETMHAGSVQLFEHFTASIVYPPYQPFYQLVRYRDHSRTRAGIEKMLELNFSER